MPDLLQALKIVNEWINKLTFPFFLSLSCTLNLRDYPHFPAHDGNHHVTTCPILFTLNFQLSNFPGFSSHIPPPETPGDSWDLYISYLLPLGLRDGVTTSQDKGKKLTYTKKRNILVIKDEQH